LNLRKEASVCTNAGADKPVETEREIRLEKTQKAQKAQALHDNCGWKKRAGLTFHTSRVVVLVIWDTQAENEKSVTLRMGRSRRHGRAIWCHVNYGQEEANAPTTHRRAAARTWAVPELLPAAGVEPGIEEWMLWKSQACESGRPRRSPYRHHRWNDGGGPGGDEPPELAAKLLHSRNGTYSNLRVQEASKKGRDKMLKYRLWHTQNAKAPKANAVPIAAPMG
jgi:hypothetical protein